MNVLLAVVFFSILLYLFVQFARQEEIQDFYEDAISDIEGRLEWAHSRKSFPYGMKAQIEISRDLLRMAKRLWSENKWQRAYQAALKSQEAIDRAQRIYSSMIVAR